eukprot:312294-Rhodomonas_salina.1
MVHDGNSSYFTVYQSSGATPGSSCTLAGGMKEEMSQRIVARTAVSRLCCSTCASSLSRCSLHCR